MDTKEAIKFINENKIFIFKTMFGGKETSNILTAIGESKIINCYHSIDLKFHPDDYLNLEDKKFFEAIRGKNKLILCDKQPRLFDISNYKDLDDYSDINLEELNSRADLVKNNKSILEKLNQIIK